MTAASPASAPRAERRAAARLVGRYEIGQRIGEGAMADVYRAYDPRIDRVLAIKILKEAYRQNRQYAARFLREAKAAGALSHPNIVTIYDVGEADGFPYIAMELLEGAPLDAAICPQGLAPTQVLEIGLQLAEALRYAHAAGVVHRDIKPSNIMLGLDGRTVKILDFGIARMTEAGDRDRGSETLQTQFGQVVGTPRYMSPEQALGQELDGRSDLFSVGAVLYELITGQKAFSASSPMSLALQITQQDPPPIASLTPDCPKGLVFIVEKLLAKALGRRFGDGERLCEALRKELAALTVAKSEVAGAAWRLPLQARVMLIMALVTSGVLLLSTGAVLDRQYRAMREMALTSGSAITAFVANNAGLRAADNAGLPPTERDWLPLQAFVRAASSDRNVSDMTVVDADGMIEASSDASRLGRRYRAAAGETMVERGARGVITASHTRDGREAFRFVRPITYAGRPFGKVDVTVDAESLAAAARLSRYLLLALGAVTLLVVMATSYAAARLFAMPVRRLTAALEEACRGNLDFRISHHRRDEFGELFDAFNRFTAHVQTSLERPRSITPGPAGAKGAPDPVRPLLDPSPPPTADRRTAPRALAAGRREDDTRTVPSAAGDLSPLWKERWIRVAKASNRRVAAPAGGS